MDKLQCELQSWEKVYSDSKKLASVIKDSGWQPDLIIGLARGGWVPARNLCDFLGIKDLLSVKMEHWGITATPDGDAKLKWPSNYDLSGKKVLIVDDCCDTGKSLVGALEHVKTMNPSEVKTGTLQVFDTSPIEPDFFSEKVQWKWIVYPWNQTEDFINLISRLLENGDKMHIDNIKLGMESFYDINLDKNTLHDVMLECERRNVVERIESEVLHWEKK